MLFQFYLSLVRCFASSLIVPLLRQQTVRGEIHAALNAFFLYFSRQFALLVYIIAVRSATFNTVFILLRSVAAINKTNILSVPPSIDDEINFFLRSLQLSIRYFAGVANTENTIEVTVTKNSLVQIET